jgi:hypothetical protein
MSGLDEFLVPILECVKRIQAGGNLGEAASDEAPFGKQKSLEAG